MAKELSKSTVDNSSELTPTVTATIISVDEYCTRRSESDRRVSLIAGFYFVMEKAGKLTGTVTEYDLEFEKFRNQGV